MDRVVASAAEAVADIPDGASLSVGGFGLCGIPSALIAACTGDRRGLRGRVEQLWRRRLGLACCCGTSGSAGWSSSYVGENKEFERQYLAGELEVELTPQGTLAEKLRAGGAGIPAFFTMTGVGTQVAEGGLPWRYDADGTVALASPPKETREFDRRRPSATYVLEEAIVTDFGLVRAWKGDRHGNLVFRESAHATSTRWPPWPAGSRSPRWRSCVEPGEIDPDNVHLPGIYVHRVVALTAAAGRRQADREAHRPRPVARSGGRSLMAWTREQMAARAAARARRRRLRQPRHRPADAGAQLRARRRRARAAVRERHPGRRRLPVDGEEDPDLINAGKETVTLRRGASFFDSATASG